MQFGECGTDENDVLVADALHDRLSEKPDGSITVLQLFESSGCGGNPGQQGLATWRARLTWTAYLGLAIAAILLLRLYV